MATHKEVPGQDGEERAQGGLERKDLEANKQDRGESTTDIYA